MPTLNQTLKEFDKFRHAKSIFLKDYDEYLIDITPALKDFISQSIKTALESVVPIGKCCGGDLMMNEDVEKCRGWNKCREQLLKNIENYFKN
jgi:cellulose biosynthesis protein BcsQ